MAPKTSMRPDGRAADELRPLTIDRPYLAWAEGSVLVAAGNTKVVCAASVEHSVPPWLAGSGQGWITAEYGMLPRSTHDRMRREAARGKQSGRTLEIQRLIGRSLRAVCDLALLGERQIVVDCDVIQADGGTRTASITGAYIAVADAVRWLRTEGYIKNNPLFDSVAAVSVGIVKGVPVLDLNYDEDSTAEVDMNVVMTGAGQFVEVQGTAEGEPFTDDDLSTLLTLAKQGVADLTKMQKDILAASQTTVA